MHVNVIGGGLAGSEVSYQLLKRGISVTLYEMRPVKMTEAHQTNNLAELVCSNSFRSNDITNAVGLLKHEMSTLGSLVIEAANYASIPAGGALAVDREMFSKYIYEKLNSFENFKLERKEVLDLNFNNDDNIVISTGPLTSDNLFKEINQLIGNEKLHFFDAIAPIIEKDSINMDVCYIKNRYDKGVASYINCPMNKEEYDLFYHELISANTVVPKDFENNVFEGCMPAEVMAKRGYETLTFGPLKPVGLEVEGKTKPYAVLQLRRDDFKDTMYNIVGFQTSLAWGEQKRVIRLVPGLENANIIRYGVIHRNTYIESPKLLNNSYNLISNNKIYFAGQISGVEGYVESAASGLNVGISLAAKLINKKEISFPSETIIGSLANYISTPNKSFVPMNANYGIISELGFKHKKNMRKELYAERSNLAIKNIMEDNNELF